jgi:hypothetical protein
MTSWAGSAPGGDSPQKAGKLSNERKLLPADQILGNVKEFLQEKV